MTRGQLKASGGFAEQKEAQGPSGGAGESHGPTGQDSMDGVDWSLVSLEGGEWLDNQ